MPADLAPFRNAIIRVLDEEGRLFGLGIVLGPELVVTCAHVVARAMDGDPASRAAPAGVVLLEAMAMGAHRPREPVRARVGDRGWFPAVSDVHADSSHPADLAVLLPERPLCPAARPLAGLSSALSFKGASITAYGAIEGHEGSPIPVWGEVKDVLASGRYLLDVSESTYRIEEGCSGGPVANTETGRVIGLIAQRELDDRIPAGFLIPAVQLRQALRLYRRGARPEGGETMPLRRFRDWFVRNRLRSSSLAGNVKRFIDNYTSVPRRPVPFVGRSREIGNMDEWLREEQGRYLMISSPAGGGKSALLLHWLARMQRVDESLNILFLPISIRFGTADKLRGLWLLQDQLASLFNELAFEAGVERGAEDYRARICDGWNFIRHDPDQRFVLVVDGLDEASGGWILRAVLPYEVPPNLHIIVSARHRPGEAGGKSWVRELERQIDPTTPETDLLELAPLSRDAVGEAVAELGHPLDGLVDQAGILDQLYRLTDRGDPLLVYLWVGQLWEDAREPAKDVTPEYLLGLRPSFRGFIEDAWLGEQRLIWAGRGLDFESGSVERVFRVLSLAKGPLFLAELLEVLRYLHWADDLTRSRVSAALRSAVRLIAGNGEDAPYVFVHPRIADYFLEKMDDEPGQRERIRRAFCAWGAAVVDGLDASPGERGACPEYLLRHYVEHLLESDLPDETLLRRHLLPLTEGGWHRAWLAAEGSSGGFLTDLHRIGERVTAWNGHLARTAREGGLLIGQELGCALIRASIATQYARLPPGLIASLVRSRVWTGRRAMRVIDDLEDAADRVDAWCQLAGALEEPERRVAVRNVLEYLSRGSEAKGRRIQVRTALADAVHGSEREQLLEEAVDLALEIEDEGARADNLARLCGYVDSSERRIDRISSGARLIRDPADSARVLLAAARRLEGGPRAEALRAAMDALEEVSDDEPRARMLVDLLPLLDEPPRSAVVERLDPGVLRLEPRLEAELIGVLPDSDRPRWLEHAWRRARSDDPDPRARTFGALLSVCPASELSERWTEASRAIAACDDPPTEITLLLGSAQRLNDADRKAALEQAHAALDRIDEPWLRTKALCALAAHVRGPQRDALLRRLFESVHAIESDDSRVHALAVLADRLRDEPAVQSLVVESLKTMQVDNWARNRAVEALAKNVPEEHELMRRVLDTAQGIWDDGARVSAYLALSRRFDGPESETLRELARSSAECVGNAALRAVAFAEVGALADGSAQRDLYRRAIEVASSIAYGRSRHNAIDAVVERVAAVGGASALQALLRCDGTEAAGSEAGDKLRAAGWRDGELGARATLAALRLKLVRGDGAVLRQAFDGVSMIRDEWERADALTALVAAVELDDRAADTALSIAGGLTVAELKLATTMQLSAAVEGDERRRALDEVLDIAAGVTDEEDRAGALQLLAAEAALDGAQLDTAWRLASELDDRFLRVQTMVEIGHRVDGDADRSAIEGTLSAIAELDDEPQRAWTLSRLCAVAELDEALLDEAWRLACALRDDRWRAWSQLQVSHRLEARAQVQAAEELVATARTCSDEVVRSLVLRQLCALPSPGPALLAKASRAAAAISNDPLRVGPMLLLGFRLDGRAQDQALTEALTAVSRATHPGVRRAFLGTLAELTASRPAVLARAFACACELEDPVARCEAMLAMGARVGGPDREKALDAVADAAPQLPEHLATALLQQVLEACEEGDAAPGAATRARLALRQLGGPPVVDPTVDAAFDLSLWDGLDEAGWQELTFDLRSNVERQTLRPRPLIGPPPGGPMPPDYPDWLAETYYAAESLAPPPAPPDIVEDDASPLEGDKWSADALLERPLDFVDAHEAAELPAALGAVAEKCIGYELYHLALERVSTGERALLLELVEHTAAAIERLGGKPALREVARRIEQTAAWFP